MSLLLTAKGIVDTGRISVATLVDSALGRLDTKACDARLAWWSEKLFRDARVDLEVRGREQGGDGSEALIVMSNHQSLYDIPALFCAVPGRLRMVAKAELFQVPIWGKAMLASGFVRIDRSDRNLAIESLRETGGALLRSGTRVWIAPEGTRSKTGELGVFKSGGFRMALDLGMRILPVAIEGTSRVLPAKGASVEAGQRVTVTLLPVVDPKTYGEARCKDLMADVRASIASALS